MTYLSINSPVKRMRPALIAGVALIIAGAMSISGLNLFNSRFGFEFLPLLVLVIWPRRANTIVSLTFVWLAGLFTDWATGDITGQWALIFVLVWGFLRPELRSDPFTPVKIFLAWLIACVVAALILSLTGYFIFGIFPDLAPLGRQAIISTLFLPIVLLLRRSIVVRLKDFDDWG